MCIFYEEGTGLPENIQGVRNQNGIVNIRNNSPFIITIGKIAIIERFRDLKSDPAVLFQQEYLLLLEVHTHSIVTGKV